MLLIIQALTIDFKAIRFDQGYVELWYTIPTADIFSFEELDQREKDVTKQYQYHLAVYSKTNTDSAFHEGIKSALVTAKKSHDYIMDYIPLYLSSGYFKYRFEIRASGDKCTNEGQIEVADETTHFYASDLIISRKNRTISSFARQGVELIPMIKPKFCRYDTLFSYLEVYGMIPDSLFGSTRYVIVDSVGKIFFSKDIRHRKCSERQIDTLSIAMLDLPKGKYKMHVAVYDPVLNKMVTRSHSLEVIETMLDIDAMPYAYEIEMLLPADEYKRFWALDLKNKKEYLSAFWSKMNYRLFEQRLIEADKKFSTSNLAGHETNLGIYYILNGPPDEIELRVMEASGNPSQVWHYDAKGLSVLFVDNNGDGNYDLVGNLDYKKDMYRDTPINWLKN